MSSEHREPDDRELDAFLRGQDPVSRAYGQTREGGPPPELDRAVLDFAQASARRRGGWSRWQRPLSLAAVLALSLGLLLELWRQPEVRAPEPVREQDRAAPAAAPPAVMPQAAAPPAEAGPALAEPVVQPSAPAPAPPPPLEARAAKPAAPAAPAAPPPAAAAAAAPQADHASADFAAAQQQLERKERSERRQQAASAEREAAVRSERESSLLDAPAPAPAAKRAAPAWGPARFDTLALGSATRDDARARFGAPASEGLSSADAQNPDRRELLYDAYERLPGFSGSFEFYYERNSLRLLSVRRVLQPSEPAAALVAELGWNEPPLVRDWRSPPCSAAAPVPAQEAPYYWLYPQRGAYLFLPTAGQVEQLVYELDCAVP